MLAGEGEPAAPDVTQQALAIAIRTFALKNAGRHAREGFDVCDGTHCQVPRASTPATRRAYSVLDCTALQRDFGIQLPDWREGLAQTLDQLPAP